MLAAGPIGDVQLDLRVCNCLDSVVATFYDQLDVACSQTINTLVLVSKHACIGSENTYLQCGDGCGCTRPSHLAVIVELLLFGTHVDCQ